MKKPYMANPPTPWDWGKQLLDANEADPPYDMLVSARLAGVLDAAAQKRWMLGFWLFYHVGVASWLTEQPNFWKGAFTVAEKKPEAVCTNGEWPRGGYRRYFRGGMATAALAVISNMGKPEDVVDWFYDGALHFRQVEKRVRQLPTYGYTMSFKIADMGERVLGFPIQFDEDMPLPEEPAKGLKIAAEMFGISELEVRERVIFNLDGCRLPGLHGRQPGVQEMETVLCEWKHMLSGKFFIGRDGPKLRANLSGFGDLADAMSRHLP